MSSGESTFPPPSGGELEDVPMGARGVVVVIFLAVALITMAGDWVGPDLIFSTLMAFYTACRFITPEEAARGFGNTSLLSVMALYMAAEGVSQTGGLERIMNYVLGSASSLSLFWVHTRMMIPVMVASAFVNNTPIVALMIPILISWGRRQNVSPKKLLLPLSYSSMLGGTCTLIGTSTNLVVAGFQQDRYPDDPKLSNMGIFDIAPYGLIYAAWGFVYILFFSRWLLPDTEANSLHDEVLVGLMVPKRSRHAGRTVSEAGLRGLEGLFLVNVSRMGKVIHAVSPDFILQEDDILYFAGDLSQVELMGYRHGLQLVTSETEDGVADEHEVELGIVPEAEGHFDEDKSSLVSKSDPSKTMRNGDLRRHTQPAIHRAATISASASATTPKVHIDRGEHATLPRRITADANGMLDHGFADLPASPSLTSKSKGPSRLLKCVLKEESELKDMSIRAAGFRGRFNAAVVAVKRNNKRVDGKIGDIVLQSHDQLILDAGLGFSQSSPDVTDNFEDMEYVDSSGEKEYLTAFVIPKGSRMAGKSVHSAGLRGMPGLFLVYIDQADGTQLHAVAPDYTLQEGDTLWFAGGLQGVAFLLKMPGLRHIDEEHTKKTNVDILERRLVQVVVAPHSHIIGKSVRELRFRTKYDAAIVAVQRRGERLKQKIGDIVLQGGDVLLLDTGEHFLSNYRDDKAFALVSEVEKSSPPKTSKMWLGLGLLIAMIATQVIQSFTTTGKEPFINLWTAALLTAALQILTRCMSGKQARQSMDWTVYVTIASAFGVSLATENTNVAQNIGKVFIDISLGIGGQAAITSCLYIATGALSEILTNNAAAALMYPIAAAAGDKLGVKPQLISVSIMLGASSAFMVRVVASFK
ncbi:citrate transporter-like domain-containing protein [Dunaliella salina]|uniref:Citrate transporter-like domain-containing protein n=1 Tax=Dunaliella salina TaxID=3046 RepID=A0ABQ7H1T7_DUNSA|nr:citrate transporter-like domain-containing protein [Dunaliella salina]|eukprot:KAF5840819.1 citrate transporter-like domain-containing protein [Dunaliella salina]